MIKKYFKKTNIKIQFKILNKNKNFKKRKFKSIKCKKTNVENKKKFQVIFVFFHPYFKNKNLLGELLCLEEAEFLVIKGKTTSVRSNRSLVACKIIFNFFKIKRYIINIVNI